MGEALLNEKVRLVQAKVWLQLEGLESELDGLFNDAWPDVLGEQFQLKLRRAKELAASALQVGWLELYLGHEKAVAEALQDVKVLVCTADWLVKQFSKLPTQEGKTVLLAKPVAVAILEEVQTFSGGTCAAVAARCPEILALGDGGQEVRYRKPPPPAPWDFSGESRRETWWPQTYPAHEFLTRSSANLLSLSTCKRCGPTVVNLCKALEPVRLKEFRSARTSADDTTVRYNFFSGAGWLSLGEAQGAQAPAGNPRTADMVLWNDLLFKCLALQVIEDLAALRSALEQPETESGHVPVLVIFWLARSAGPFRHYLNEVLRQDDVAAHVGVPPDRLRGAVQVRLAAHTSGLTCRRSHVVRHRRYKSEEFIWRGVQSNRNLRYIALTRATDELTLWVEHQGQPGAFGAQGWQDFKRHVSQEQGEETDARHRSYEGRSQQSHIASLREELDVAKGMSLPMAEVSPPRGGGTAQTCVWHAARSVWGPALFACCTAYGSEQLVSDVIPSLDADAGFLKDSVSLMRAKAWEAAELREAVLHYGDGSWPVDDRRKAHWLWTQVALDTGSLLLNAVTVKLSGPRSAQVCLPLLCGWPEEPPYPGQNKANGCPVLRSLACAIWFVHDWLLQTLGLDEASLCLRSRAHKATVEKGGDFFVKACESDREAVLLVPARHMQEAAAWAESEPWAWTSRPPPPPKDYLFYMYLGGGVEGQPKKVWGLVLRTRSRPMTLASCLTATILGRCSRDGHFPTLWDGRMFHGAYQPRNGAPEDVGILFGSCFKSVAAAWHPELLQDGPLVGGGPAGWRRLAEEFFRSGHAILGQRGAASNAQARHAYDELMSLCARTEQPPPPGPPPPPPPGAPPPPPLGTPPLRRPGALDQAAPPGLEMHDWALGPGGQAPTSFLQEVVGEPASASGAEPSQAWSFSEVVSSGAGPRTEEEAEDDTWGSWAAVEAPPSGAPTTTATAGGSATKRPRTVSLGFDVGGVILAQGQGSVPVDGCVAHLQRLRDVFGQNSLWIISRVNGVAAQHDTLRSLRRIEVVGKLVPESQVLFCFDYSGYGGKGRLCKEKALDVFVDDKMLNLMDIKREHPGCRTILFVSEQSTRFQAPAQSRGHETAFSWEHETAFSWEELTNMLDRNSLRI